MKEENGFSVLMVSNFSVLHHIFNLYLFSATSFLIFFLFFTYTELKQIGPIKM